MRKQLAAVVLCCAAILAPTCSVHASKSGCEYWDALTLDEINAQLEMWRERWLAIKPTASQVRSAREIEIQTIAGLGYRNAGRMVSEMEDDFFVRRIRLKEFQAQYNDALTDEELWIYCVDGPRSECAAQYDQNGPPIFDDKGKLKDPDPRVQALIDAGRPTVGAFNLYAQIIMFSFCDCDASDEAQPLCERARAYLLRDF